MVIMNLTWSFRQPFQIRRELVRARRRSRLFTAVVLSAASILVTRAPSFTELGKIP
jgi:hypothetical protein